MKRPPLRDNKNAENELKNLASFPQLNPNPVLEVNRKGKVLYCNPAALKQFPDIIKKGSAHPILKGFFNEQGKIENEVRIGDRWYYRPSYFVRGKDIKHIYCIDITDRKKAEEKLRDEHGYLQSLLNTAQTIMLILDTRGKIVDLNPYMEELSGYRLDEVKGKDWFDTFLPGHDHKRIRDLFKKAINNIQTRGNVNPILTKDGHEIYVEWHDKTLKDNNGRTIGLLATGQDVTERKKAEEQLRESEGRYRALVENASDQVFMFDEKYKIVSTNSAASMLSGKKPDEMIGKYISEIFSKETASKNIKNLEVVFKSGRNYYVEEELIIGANKLYVSTSLSPVKNSESKTTAVLGVVRDITKRKNAEEELRERERKLKTIFDVLPVGVSILDAKRKIIYVNPALERITGISMEGLFRGDHKSRKYLRPDGTPMPAEEYASARAVKEQRAIYNIETGVVKEDGSIIWTDVSAVPVKFPDWKVVIVTSDITKRRRSEEELQKSERYRMMGTFISGIAHEIRNPLVSVKGFFQLLNDRETSEKDKQEIAKLAVDEIKRVESLLDNLLNFAKPSKGESIDSDIHKLISDCIILVKHDASNQRIKIITQLDADPSQLRVDPKQVQQVFLNLSMNALDAMKNGGTLRISTSYLKDQNMISVTFRDTGCGIKQEYIPRLFEPFFTTKENGTGLGLSISQRIIENYKGKINIESKEGKGTSVHITLPAL